MELNDKAEAVPLTAQRVLALVSLHHSIDRTAAASTLWPDVPEQRAAASLRSALWRLHAVSDELIDNGRRDLALSECVRSDVDDLITCARRLSAGQATGGTSDILFDIRFGELLPRWEEDWVILERERMRQLLLHALCDLAVAFVRNDHDSAAMAALLKAVALEPMRESTHRLLIRLHLRAGNFSEALRCFEVYQRSAVRELGVPPSALMTTLIQRIPRNGTVTRR